MVAFGSVDFFLLAGALSVPAVLLGLCGLRIKYWGMVATTVMVAALVWHTPLQAGLLVAFLAYQTALTQGHLAFVRARGRKVLWEKRLVVVASLLPLVASKLAGTFHLSGWGFLGISYVTFRATQVIVETSDGLIEKLPVLDWLYFMAFFPVVSSGPIDRSRRFMVDADHAPDRAGYRQLLGRGLWLLVLGAGYKFIGAAYFGHLVDQLPAASVVRYMYCYSLDLFLDFAGYSHMAVGMSYLFGIRTPVNFRMPFVAESIKDFWNRWHVSLSFWLRDFVFTRVLMNLIKKHKGLQRTTAANIAYMTNMLAMGFWHGLTGYYVVYGLYHGLLMVLNEVYERRCPLYRHHRATWYRLAAIVVTAHLVMFGFLIFSGHLITV